MRISSARETDAHGRESSRDDRPMDAAGAVHAKSTRPPFLGKLQNKFSTRYLNVTDEELRKGLEVSWSRRTLRVVAGGLNA